jgi:hypothetical protein
MSRRTSSSRRCWPAGPNCTGILVDTGLPGTHAKLHQELADAPPSLVTHDRGDAERSVAQLAGLDVDVAVFGHGAPVQGRAVERFRELAAKG